MGGAKSCARSVIGGIEAALGGYLAGKQGRWAWRELSRVNEKSVECAFIRRRKGERGSGEAQEKQQEGRTIFPAWKKPGWALFHIYIFCLKGATGARLEEMKRAQSLAIGQLRRKFANAPPTRACAEPRFPLTRTFRGCRRGVWQCRQDGGAGASSSEETKVN